jgi:hypothetical protein
MEASTVPLLGMQEQRDDAGGVLDLEGRPRA